MTRSTRGLGTFAVAALIVLASPVRAQQAVDSAARADSVRDDSLWHAQLRKLRRATDTTRHVRADIVPPVRAQAPKALVDTAARAHVDSVRPAPALPPVAAPVVAPVVQAEPPVRVQAPKAPVDTAARAHVDSVKPARVLAPVAAPVVAPVVQADTVDRARMDSSQRARWGQYVWKNRQCEGCHELGRDQSSGPNLVGVTDRRTVEWLRKWLKSPAAMTRDDSVGIALKKKYGSQMPDLPLSTRDIEGLIIYLARETQARSGR